MENTYKLTSLKYSVKMSRFGNEFFYLERKDVYKKKQLVIDTFGPIWIFMYGKFSHDCNLKLLTKATSIQIIGTVGILVPPHSIVKWQVDPGEITWSAIVSTSVLPEKFLDEPTIYSWPSGTPPLSLNDFFSNLKQPLFRNPSETFNSMQARKLKEYIEAKFKENSLIEDFSIKNEISRTSLTRTFKKNYGLTPVEYRSRVRIFNACKTLLDGGNVTAAMLDSGFNDPSQFFFFFKQLFGITPSEYHLAKKLKFDEARNPSALGNHEVYHK